MKPLAMIAACLWMMSSVVSAQTAWTPSTDDLIKQLKPTAGGPTRGLRVRSTGSAPVANQSSEPAAPVRTEPTRTASAMPGSHVTTQPLADAQGTANLSVQFENGSDRLTPGATRILDALGRALSNADLAGYNFRIVGHTDSVGSPGYNQALSERRAAAVADYIASHFKIDPNRLTALGRGQDEPLIPTAEGVAEPRNRRVQIINTGA